MKNNTPLYSWHEKPWQDVMRSYESKTMPHALQLIGQEGLGKTQFALKLAEHLLCGQGACGLCHACQLFSLHTHPDLLIIKPEEEKAIKIDEVRDVITFVNETPQQGICRIVIIQHAGQMNTASANALLKTLEEPPRDVYILLLTDRVAHLPLTIASRCQKINFRKPSTALALEWLVCNTTAREQELKKALKLANGAPLSAKKIMEAGIYQLHEDFCRRLSELAQKKTTPIAVAAEFHDKSFSALLNFLLTWMHDLFRILFSRDKNHLTHVDYSDELEKIAPKMGGQTIITYLDEISEVKRDLRRGIHLNRQLILEALLIKWARYATS